jgi:hypothetical protein
MAVMLIMRSSNRSSRQPLQLWTPLLSAAAVQNHKRESQVTALRIPTPLMMMMMMMMIKST